MERHTRIISILGILFVLFFTFTAFSPCLNNDFVNWDEDAYLLRNPDVRVLNIENTKRIISTSILRTYSPLTVLSFAFEYHFFKYEPRVYHAVNLILHLAVVGLIILFAAQCGLGFRGALWSGLLFGLHPVHVESVAWVVERKDVLYAFFYMGALCAYMAYLPAKNKKFYALAVVCGLFSMLSKAMALSLPLILWICDRFVNRKDTRTALIDKIPFFLYIVPIAWVTYSLNARIPGEGLIQSLLTWVWTFMFYVKTFLFPITLLPIYRLPEPINLSNLSYLGALVSFGIIMALLYAYRKDKWVVFAFGFFFFSIFFCLRFDQKVDVNIVADRFLYLPCLGFCLFLGRAADQGLSFLKTKPWILKEIFTAAIMAIYLFLGIKTYHQCGVWKNTLTLWQYMIKENPRESRGYDNLAAGYLNLKDYESCVSILKKAIALDPRNFESYNNLGLAYLKMDSAQNAIEYFQKALKLRPDSAVVHNNLGIAFKDTGEIQKAQSAFHKAISLDPRQIEARLNLAQIYADQMMSEQAEQLYYQNLAVDPKDHDTLAALINLYRGAKQPERLLPLAKTIMSQVNDEALVLQLAHIFVSYSMFIPALDCYENLIQKNSPNARIAYIESGKIAGNFNNFPLAISLWKQGLRRYPNDQELSDLIKKTEQLISANQ